MDNRDYRCCHFRLTESPRVRYRMLPAPQHLAGWSGFMPVHCSRVPVYRAILRTGSCCWIMRNILGNGPRTRHYAVWYMVTMPGRGSRSNLHFSYYSRYIVHVRIVNTKQHHPIGCYDPAVETLYEIQPPPSSSNLVSRCVSRIW